MLVGDDRLAFARRGVETCSDLRRHSLHSGGVLRRPCRAARVHRSNRARPWLTVDELRARVKLTL